MKRLYSGLIKYYSRMYFTSVRFVMPFVLLAIILTVHYSTIPVTVVNSLMFTMNALFFLMIWIGMGFGNMEEPVAEQVMLLKSGNSAAFYISRILFLCMLSAIMAVFCMIYPVLHNAANHFRTFSRSLTMSDIIRGYFLHWFMGMAGAVTGYFLHPRLVRDRRLALLLVFSIALLSITKGPVTEQIPLLKYILWMLPPAYETTNRFARQEIFALAPVLKSILYLGIYGTALSAFQTWLLIRKKF